MQPQSFESRQPGACSEFEPSLLLYAVGELEAGERDRTEQHLRQCPACAAFLEEGQRLLDVVRSAQPDEPSAHLLSVCRSSLADALDQMGERGVFTRWAGSLLSGNWFGLRPALGSAVLLLIGFSIGTLAPRFLRSLSTPGSVSPVGSSSQADLLNDQFLRGADVSGIKVTPAGENTPPQVEVHLNAERPLVVKGDVNDNDVKRVFLYVLQNNSRFSPDVRLDSVELLRPRYSDPDVSHTLCDLVRTDSNPAVRLKAIEALHTGPPGAPVQSALLHALASDSNPGVRIEAANALLALVDKGAMLDGPGQMQIVRDAAQKDSNNYVRLQSAAVLRRLQPAEGF